jgi:phenylacetate-CoA ligase
MCASRYLFKTSAGLRSFTNFSVPKNEKPLRPIFDVALGCTWDMYWKTTTCAWPLFQLRFKLWTNEKTLFAASNQRANAAFFNAYYHVPAYKKHIGPDIPKKFSDIPETTKENYIKPHVENNNIHLTLMNGQIPFNGQIDTSTGTSGNPTPWIRGQQEINAIKNLANFASRVVMGNNHVMLINAFALGPWATGITVSNVMRKRALMFSTGPDLEKIFNILRQFPPTNYPDLRYVISGYPPFMKDFVEFALKNNLDLGKYKITAIVGGEEISDAIRYQTLGVDSDGKKIQSGFDRVISTYGASDLDINIGYESDFEIALRSACKKNTALRKELLGDNETIPMMFHYDPLNYFIETNANKDLIFTCVRNDRASPRIRYNLRDRGMVVPVSDVMACLEKHEVKIHKPNTCLPLLFVWGREGAITYRGSKVAASQLEEAIIRSPEFKGKIANFAFNSYEKEGSNQLEFWLEFRSEEDYLESKNNISVLNKLLLKNLMDINQDFKFQIQNAPVSALPSLKIFRAGLSPMSHQDPQRKKKYVYNENGLQKTYKLG